MVVDLKRIPELQRLEIEADGLHIGAARSLTDIAEFPVVLSDYKGLADSSVLVGSWQIQNRAGIGGNVCNAAPSGDTIPALLSHETSAIVASSSGRREIALSDFFAGPGQTVLQKDEILVELVLPPIPDDSASSYLRFIPRNEMDIAVAGAGVSVQLDNGTVKSARVALSAVAPTPLLVEEAAAALEGKAPTADNIQAAADKAREAARPITDMRGTIEFRKHLCEVLTRRALTTAVERAKEAR
jgi:carbon-monoxide dehydrogenase medium subunit